MLAYCGLNCDTCDAYKATISGDQEGLKKAAEGWHVTPKDVICLGCTSDTPFVSGFLGACEVRSCAIKKGLSLCAACGDYAGCEKIAAFHSKAPKAKALTDLLRLKLG
jgi:hypothetical protein